MRKSSFQSSSGKIFSGKVSPLKQSTVRTVPDSGLTEITIETNDKEVPYISIFKPDIIKQQKKVYSAVSIVKMLKKGEEMRVGYGFGKLVSLAHLEKGFSMKINVLSATVRKVWSKKLQRAFWQLLLFRVKKGGLVVGCKIVKNVQVKNIDKSIKFAWNQLRRNSLVLSLRQLSNQSETVKQINSVKVQLNKFKEEVYCDQFIKNIKPLQRAGNYQSFLKNIQSSNLQNMLKQQIKRFQDFRNKGFPKRRDVLDNQLVITITNNVLTSYQMAVAQQEKYAQQLQESLNSYADAEGIVELRGVIQQKEGQFREIDNFMMEVVRLDNQLKRQVNDVRSGNQKILNLLLNQQKKIQTRLKDNEGVTVKIATSRSSFGGMISILLKRSEQQKQAFKKQITDIIQTNQSSEKLKLLLKRSVKDQMLKTLVQKLILFQSRAEVLQQQKSGLLSRCESETNSINFILDYINKNQQKLQQQVDITPFQLSYQNQIAQDVRPLLYSVVTLLKKTQTLHQQNKLMSFNPVQVVSAVDSNTEYFQSQTKEISYQKLNNKPNKSKVSISSQEKILADKFITPSKEEIQQNVSNSAVKYLKNQLAEYETKMSQIIEENKKMQFIMKNQVKEYELKLRKYEMQSLGVQQIIKNKSKEYQLNVKEKLVETKVTQAQFKNQIREYELKIIELQERFRIQLKERQMVGGDINLLNRQLSSKQTIIEQCNNRIKQLSASNKELSQKIIELSNKSLDLSRQSSQSQQQMNKQNQLLNQIISLKIQIETAKMSRFEDVNKLNGQLSNLKGTISQMEMQKSRKQMELLKSMTKIRQAQNQVSSYQQQNKSLIAKLQYFQESITTHLNEKTKQYQSIIEEQKKQNSNLVVILHQLQSQLNNSNQSQALLIAKLSDQQRIIQSISQQNQDLRAYQQQLQVRQKQLQCYSSQLRMQIAQLKKQYFELQMELTTFRNSNSHIFDKNNILQVELKEKQNIIQNLLEQSKNNNDGFTSRIFDCKEELANKIKYYEEILNQKQVLINRGEFQLRSRNNTIQNLNQRIVYLQHSSKANSSIQNWTNKDGEIQQLNKKIYSLEQFLNLLNNQYKELEIKYQHQRSRNSTPIRELSLSDSTSLVKNQSDALWRLKESTYISQINQLTQKINNPQFQQGRSNTQYQNQQVQAAMSQSIQPTDISQQIRNLMMHNDMLTEANEQLRVQKDDLMNKLRSMPQPEYIVELMFNLLLLITKINPKSQQGSKLWFQLTQIGNNCQKEDLFNQLEDYASKLILKQ